MMSWRYALFSLLLLAAVGLLAQKNYEVWTRPLEISTEEGRTKKVGPKPESISPHGVSRHPTALGSAILISEKNIFNPERKEFSITLPASPKPSGRPQVVLYGVTLAQDFQAASLVHIGRPLRKGEREMITLRIGERVGEYRLTKILPDRITLESGEDSFDVLLYDASAPKKRAVIKTDVKPPQVTSTAPAPAPSQPVATPPSVAATPPVPPTVPVPAPKAPEAPQPGEPPRERVIEAPLPRPVPPLPPSYPGTLRGRRPVRPYSLPEGEGQ